MMPTTCLRLPVFKRELLCWPFLLSRLQPKGGFPLTEQYVVENQLLRQTNRRDGVEERPMPKEPKGDLFPKVPFTEGNENCWVWHFGPLR